MTPEPPEISPLTQEALSRKYSNDLIILLPLRNQFQGADCVAVFNSIRELCGFVPLTPDGTIHMQYIQEIWRPPAPAPQTATMLLPSETVKSLEELGL